MTEQTLPLVPFTIAIPQAAIDDLHQRLARTRWTDEMPGSGWSYGSSLTYMKELVHYWQTSFDWRSQERILNSFPHFRTVIDGIGIHFLHARGKGDNIPFMWRRIFAVSAFLTR